MYAWLVRNANAEQREQIKMQLTAPIGDKKKTKQPTQMTEEQEGDLFMSALKQLKGA